MLLVFTFLCVTSQTKALTLHKTLDFHINFVREKRTISIVLDKNMKNDLIENNPEWVTNYALTSWADRYKRTRVRLY